MKQERVEFPFILFVNAKRDVLDSLENCVRRAFGDYCTWATYSYPGVEQFPRMRPERKPEFELVVVDVADWVSNNDDDMSLLRRSVIPEWFKMDFIERTQSALLVVLVPSTKVLQGMINKMRRQVGPKRFQLVEVFAKESLEEASVDNVAKLLASRWQKEIAKEPFFKRLIEGFQTPD